MAITTDYQGEIRSLTFGADTPFVIDIAGITGLGAPVPRARDSERGDRHGDVAAADLFQRRIITIPFHLLGDDSADAGSLRRDLAVAWRPAADNIPLDLRIPGTAETVVRSYGRPRGLDVDVSILRTGTIGALGTFEALDPIFYGAEVVDASPSSMSVAGDMPTDRAVITITGTGGTPRIINTSDDDGEIRWGMTLAGSAVRIVDLHARTVLTTGNVDKYAELSPLTDWFVLQPGTNTLSITGCTASIAYRPAYL